MVVVGWGEECLGGESGDGKKGGGRGYIPFLG